MFQRTLAIAKPDAVLSGWTQHIKHRYRSNGLKMVVYNSYQMTRDQAAEFYNEHNGRFFFNGLILAMSSGLSDFYILEGENAVELVRKLNGATDPDKAEVGTIRRDFKSAGGVFNTVHGSADEAAAQREIHLVRGWWI